MPSPRKNHMSLSATPYYHVTGQCVKRSFLNGKDAASGRDYSHRKAWVVERLEELASVFAVNVAAYAVMPKHYHFVLFVDAARTESWTETEVANRWSKLFALPAEIVNYLKGESTNAAEKRHAQETLVEFRRRLCDLSWFIRSFNEPVARRANKEDGATGRFWEGRFKSRPILDEAGLLAVAAYVDLNPVRDGSATTAEKSVATTVQLRLQDVAAEAGAKRKANALSLSSLHPFASAKLSDASKGLPFTWTEYAEVLDWASRSIRRNKKQAHQKTHQSC